MTRAITLEESMSRLTAPQYEAATHFEGPALVLAGPGSGKTRVITHRIAWLISQGVAPWNILGITFTNKAAEEMRHRLAGMRVPRGALLCTFHSLAARLLREFATEAGLPGDFSIYDDADQKTAMREAIKVCDLDPQNFPPNAMLYKVSSMKNDLKLPDDVAKQFEYDFRATHFKRIYEAYQEQLTTNNALDFDDLLMKLAFLLRDRPEIRHELNRRYQFVLVDEYQDTNHCQYQIARGLTIDHHNLFVTGDPDQSIYGWRGADIGNILAFEEDYPNARVVRLEENFRSIPEVLQMADDLIRQNSRRKHKNLFTAIPSGAQPEMLEFYNEYEEADGIAGRCKQWRADGIDYRDMAVFYRVNSMSRVVEDAMRRAGIPYQIVKGLEFFKRAEIKDMIAYLRFLVNPADQVSFARIVNKPTRGIGNTTIQRILEHCHHNRLTIWDTLQHLDEIATLNTAAKSKIRLFTDMIAGFKKEMEGGVSHLLRTVYENTGLQKNLKAEKTEEPHLNVMELINSAVQFESENENPALPEYLHQIALASDSDAYNSESGAVSLMTLHSAKGLEFPVVVIVGVEEGLIPHSRSKNDKAELEEERRLLFVGITRAQRLLNLTCARNRTTNGFSAATIRSQFVRHLSGLQFTPVASTRDLVEDSGSNDSYDSDLTYDSSDIDAGPSSYDEAIPNFRINQLVRHPSLGIGKITKVIPLRENSKVEVQFQSGQRKTLVLKYARLEPMDYD